MTALEEDLPDARNQVELQAARTLRDRDAAQDVAQEAAARALAQPALQGGEDVRRWLQRVGRNLTIDELRRRQREVPVGDDLPDLPDPTADLLTVLERRAFREELAATINSLPPAQADLVTARFVDGLDAAALAATAGITHAAMRKRIERAHKALTTEWARRGYAVALLPLLLPDLRKLDRLHRIIAGGPMLTAALALAVSIVPHHSLHDRNLPDPPARAAVQVAEAPAAAGGGRPVPDPVPRAHRGLRRPAATPSPSGPALATGIHIGSGGTCVAAAGSSACLPLPADGPERMYFVVDVVVPVTGNKPTVSGDPERMKPLCDATPENPLTYCTTQGSGPYAGPRPSPSTTPTG